MSETPASTQTSEEHQLQGSQKPSKNRSAFLLGLELAQQQIDDLRMHVFQLSEMLPMSKILLLDAALARIALFACETASMRGVENMNTEIGMFAKSYSMTRSFLAALEWKYVMAAAGHLVNNLREIQPWYSAGFHAGQLFKDMSPSNRGCQSIDDFSNRIDAFGELIAEAVNRRPAAICSELDERLLAQLDRILMQPRSFESLLAKLLELPALIDDAEPELAKNEQDRRNAFIYDCLVKGVHGEKAVQQIKKECDKQGWSTIEKWDQIKRIADSHALENGLPPVPIRPPGRPPGRAVKKNKPKNKTG